MTELFAQLLRQDFAELEAAARSWASLAKKLGDTQAGCGKYVSGPLHRDKWAGVGADYGFAALEATESKLGTGRVNAQLIHAVLDTLHTRMQESQRKLRNAVADAEKAGHTVRADGWVEPVEAVDPKYHNDPDYQGVQQRANAGLGGYRARIEAAVTEASTVCTQAAELLHQIDPFDLDKRYGADHAREDAVRVGEFRGLGRKSIPDGKDPQQTADWWAGLHIEDREMYLAAYPEQLGTMDGLPAGARNTANRTNLDMQLNDYALREGSLGYHDRYLYGSLSKLKDKLDQADAAPPDRQLYLLKYGLSKDGTAVVSVGNPDTAKHTAVFVPGTSHQLDSVGGDIDRAGDLQSAAGRWNGTSGTKDVAVVSWLDYNAPELNTDSVGSADLSLGIASDHRAKEGAERLRDFTHGLRAAHQGDQPTHLTVLGHSYGSTTVGAADVGGDGLGADDAVVLGSPGLTVKRADQLHMDPRHLWVGAASDDLVSNVLSGASLGADPKDPGFGAQRMYVDTSGHSGYWDGGSQSLENQGRIIAGKEPENGGTD
ncbi:alpha/beta hydrolase [Streptomyces sp. TLI_146]|uniref:alpha/beta hydrolase n=1 Tax=Streptomyces sp. TLI_146 TaxID=1938858 RepID=UPI000C70C943|nr:alpha/beta hydrolase [Streptomyces sp. TLI_146]PKV85989.1 alpha/beta hydrolase family protein [Streptomyces sp. TLI_146]